MQAGSPMPDAGGDAGPADPRAADVADAERLLAEADVSGVARLPELSTAELWVLCGVDQVIATEPEARWWASLAEPDREKLTGTVLEFLTHRRLLRPGSESGRLLVSAALGMIVAARQNPEVVVITTDSDGSVAGTPRMFGVGEAMGLPRAVVGEHVSGEVMESFGPVHDFSLLSVARAGHVLARWATRAGAGEQMAGGQPRIIDFYAYTDGELASRDQATVSGSHGGYVVTRQRIGAGEDPSPPFACDLAGLAGMLTGMLALERP
jgi:hypothetical protein